MKKEQKKVFPECNGYLKKLKINAIDGKCAE